VHPEVVRRVLQPCLHRLIARQPAERDGYRRATTVIGLDAGRRDLGAVRRIYEREDDDRTGGRLAGPIPELDDERVPDRITGHPGLTITGYD
jgi:hypothetical protein